MLFASDDCGYGVRATALSSFFACLITDAALISLRSGWILSAYPELGFMAFSRIKWANALPR